MEQENSGEPQAVCIERKDPSHPRAENGFRPIVIRHEALGQVALFKNLDGQAHATVYIGPRWQTYRMGTEVFMEAVARAYYKKIGSVPGKKELKQLVQGLIDTAKFDGPEAEIHTRYAKSGNAVYVDLCNKEGHVVEITADGWKIKRHNPGSVPFVRNAGMLAQVFPEKGGKISDLAPFLNVRNEEQFVLIVSYILGAMNPDGPFPVLNLHGPQGSTKSTMLKMMRDLVDPAEAALTSEPSSERDLFISAGNCWMQCIDNVSNITPKMSDAYCRLSTSGAFRTRKLYTNGEEIIIKVKRPVAFNGIAPFASQNDLLDRCLWLTLPSVEPGNRRPESRIWAEWEKAKPYILGAFYDAVAMALGKLDLVKLDRLPRMADFAQWMVAAEQACPWKPGTFIKAYEDNRAEIIDQAIEADSLGDAVIRCLKDRNFLCQTPSELFNALKTFGGEDSKKDREWPKTVIAMSKKLMRLEGFLASKGIQIKRERQQDKRLIILQKADGKAPKVILLPYTPSAVPQAEPETVDQEPEDEPVEFKEMTEEQHQPLKETVALENGWTEGVV